MSQKYTILFDLDGTLVDTAPDLMAAHNHVMKKFGYSTKSVDEIRNLVGKGAAVLIGRSIWGAAKKEFSKITDEKIKNEMVKEFIDFYGKNLVIQSKLIKGVKEFLDWAKSNKMQQIAQNKEVAFTVCFEGISGNGIGENLGWVLDPKNAELRAKLRKAFVIVLNLIHDKVYVGTSIIGYLWR